MASEVKLLNVSYDPTRESYKDFNAAFARQWQRQKGQKVEIETSHGGSGKPARSVMDGLEADVATLALAYYIDSIAQHDAAAGGLAETIAGKQHALHPDHRVPGAQGQPETGQGLAGTVAPRCVAVITPNPKTSGGARWNYLAA